MSVPQPAVPGWLPVDLDQFLYLLVLSVAVPMFLLAANLTRGGLGRVLVSIRDNERAATRVPQLRWPSSTRIRRLTCEDA